MEGEYVYDEALEGLTRNTDSIIEMRCQIPKPHFFDRARALCLEFCEQDRGLDLF